MTATLTPPDARALILQVYPVADRMARRLNADADDLAQEAVIALMAWWGRYDPARRVSRKAWVTANARYAMINACRDKAVGRALVRVPRHAYAAGVRVNVLSYDDEVPGGGRQGTYAELIPRPPRREVPTTDAEAADLFGAAVRLLGRGLRPREEQLLRLHFVYGLTFKECSKRMGLSEEWLHVTMAPLRDAADAAKRVGYRPRPADAAVTS